MSNLALDSSDKAQDYRRLELDSKLWLNRSATGFGATWVCTALATWQGWRCTVMGWRWHRLFFPEATYFWFSLQVVTNRGSGCIAIFLEAWLFWTWSPSWGGRCTGTGVAVPNLVTTSLKWVAMPNPVTVSLKTSRCGATGQSVDLVWHLVKCWVGG